MGAGEPGSECGIEQGLAGGIVVGGGGGGWDLVVWGEVGAGVAIGGVGGDELAIAGIDGDFAEVFGAGEPSGRVVPVKAEHGAVEDRSCAGNSRDAFHRLVFKISGPDADGEIRGVAEAPIVVEIRGCAGFNGAAEW